MQGNMKKGLLTSRDWEDGRHDEDSCDQGDPAHSNPADHNTRCAQVEWPRLEVLVVEEADADGDGICTTHATSWMLNATPCAHTLLKALP